MRTKSRINTALMALTAVLICVGMATAATRPRNSQNAQNKASYSRAASTSFDYPYRSSRFTEFIKESYTDGNAGDPYGFYTWFEKEYRDSNYHYPGYERLTLPDLLALKSRQFSRISDLSAKANSEAEFGAWLHRMVKTTIPRFSLDRGFEFYYTVRLGERQCFLQSVLISSMLQKAGVNAGVAMVYRNIAGAYTNNGHAISLVKLPNGQDIVVDASEPEPFAKHQGLFFGKNSYGYAEPVYADDSPRIDYYKTASGGRKITTDQAKGLDYDFLRSQFWYYRGERAPGALLSSKKTSDGLKLAESRFRTSVKLCPDNPLAVFMLGRTYYSLGEIDQAKSTIARANRLYRRFGWVPEGPKTYLALVNEKKTAEAR